MYLVWPVVRQHTVTQFVKASFH